MKCVGRDWTNRHKDFRVIVQHFHGSAERTGVLHFHDSQADGEMRKAGHKLLGLTVASLRDYFPHNRKVPALSGISADFNGRDEETKDSCIEQFFGRHLH